MECLWLIRRVVLRISERTRELLFSQFNQFEPGTDLVIDFVLTALSVLKVGFLDPFYHLVTDVSSM